jgi:rubrerythrin
MDLDHMLERARGLEERASALYRRWAAISRTEPEFCALWTALAREEEEHARSVAFAGSRIEVTAGWRTWLEGWDDAVAEVEERLAEAERLGAEDAPARRLSAALELELTELETLRQAILAATRTHDVDTSGDHAVRLAEAAERLSDDPQVRLQAAVLKARSRLRHSA